MKKVILIIALAGLSVSAFAMKGGPHDDMRMLYETLDLTKEQKTELTAIRKETRDARIKLMDQMEAVNTKSRERVMAVLTEAQRAELKAQRAEMRKLHGSKTCDHAKMAYRNPKYE